MMLYVTILTVIAGAVWWLDGQYQNSFYLLGKYYSSAKIFPAYKWDATFISEHFPAVDIFLCYLIHWIFLIFLWFLMSKKKKSCCIILNKHDVGHSCFV